MSGGEIVETPPLGFAAGGIMSGGGGGVLDPSHYRSVRKEALPLRENLVTGSGCVFAKARIMEVHICTDRRLDAEGGKLE